MVDRETGFAQQLVALIELGRAQTGNGGGNIENVVGDLADHQIRLVGRRAGNDHVGVFGPSLAQHRRLDAIANHAAQVQTLFQQPQASRVLVDDGDVVLLGHQAFSDAFAHAASAEDDDVHNLKSYVNDRRQPVIQALKARAE